MASFNLLKIKNIQRETSKAVSISFDVPEVLKNTYVFEAGQYLTLKTKINGQEVRRDYSISASPSSEELTVTIKEIEGGLFSSFANQQLNPGDSIEVAPPKGRFTFVPNTNNNNTIVAFAAVVSVKQILDAQKALNMLPILLNHNQFLHTVVQAFLGLGCLYHTHTYLIHHQYLLFLKNKLFYQKELFYNQFPNSKFYTTAPQHILIIIYHY